MFDTLQARFRNGTTLVRLIFLNVGVWLAVKLAELVLTLLGLEAHAWLGYVEMPAACDTLLHRPWTVLTYMFLHTEFFHLFFNMLCLYWFGQLFLGYFSQKQLVGVYILGGLGGALAYLGAYNLLPYFAGRIGGSYLLGASASIMGIILAIAVAEPNYPIRLFLIGEIRMKYVAAITVLISVFGVTGGNAGGELAHLGGALVGFLYARLWRQGHDLAWPINKLLDGCANLFGRSKIKRRKPKFRSQPKTDAEYNQAKVRNDAEIDRILDKIKRSGYQSLTDRERETLFSRSNQ